VTIIKKTTTNIGNAGKEMEGTHTLLVGMQINVATMEI
jgi:hypothetical protein